MRGVLARWVLVAMLLGGRAYAQTPADREAIQGVIAAQLDAFRHDDAAAAFGFAAPNIQQMFGDPDHFMAMVKRGYPPIYRPRDFTFQDLGTAADGQLFQHVRVWGADEAMWLATYVMERGADGVWRIAACLLEQPPGADT